MNDYKIPIQKALTDSLSLSLPYHDCHIIDKRLTDMPILYYPSLDEYDDELLNAKPITIERNGIKLRFSLAEIPDWQDKKNTLKFIRITLNAKLLKQRYFEGITNENKLLLYNQLISYNVIRFSFKTFLNGSVSDIDICYNDYTPSLKHFSSALDCAILDSLDKKRYLKKFFDTATGNYGLSFNQRQTASPSQPFIKLYHKEHELYNRSPEFWNTYLQKDYCKQIKNLTRIEVTIKNYAHKRRLIKYGLIPKFKTLQEYLLIKENDLKNVIVFSAKTYIGKKPRIKSPNLSPTDHLIFEMIQSLYLKGSCIDDILNLVDLFHGNTPEVTNVSRSRMRKKVKDLSNLILFKDLKLKTEHNYNQKVYSYLKRMNLIHS